MLKLGRIINYEISKYRATREPVQAYDPLLLHIAFLPGENDGYYKTCKVS